MLKMGYPAHLVNRLAKLYSKQKAKVRVAGTRSNGFQVKGGGGGMTTRRSFATPVQHIDRKGDGARWA